MQILKKLLLSFLLTSASLIAVPQAVVFDWGNVIAFEDRSVVVNFMCETFHFSEEEFEITNLEKRKAMKTGMTDIEFWEKYAYQQGISLSTNWPQQYQETLKQSIGADPEMLSLIDNLKQLQVRVGLLSNINDKYTKLIRDFGFYEPFSPCLLSCEMGLEKPHKEAYELLLHSLNLPAEEVVFIDDKQENIEAAIKLGIDGIVYKSSDQVRSQLKERGFNL